MVYVFIGCLIAIWEVSAFPSQTPFQYVPLMQIRWRQREIQFARLARIRLFTVFVYNRKS